MRRSLFLRAAWIALITGVAARDEEPLRVEARAGRGPYYVGQAVEIRVGVVAGDERPRLTPTRVGGVPLATIGSEFRQIEASGIGDVVAGTNLYVTRFRWIAMAPGPATIPPFFASLGDRSGSSSPIRLTIRPVPSEGRPPSFLGGVGRIVARSEALPDSVRLGQAFDLNIKLEGPGARGSTRWPAIGLPSGVEVERGGSELVDDPPSRTFHHRVRPGAPGTLAIPSVAVATFDPELGRYNETRTSALSIRVADVPRFDPATLPTTDAPTRDGRGGRAWLAPAIGAGLAITAALAIRRRRTVSRRGLRRDLEAMARRIESSPSGFHPANEVERGITLYLSRTIGRPDGVLTPIEAKGGVGLALGDPSLADRAGAIIARSDRLRYGERVDHDPGLAAEAAAVLRSLARAERRRRRG